MAQIVILIFKSTAILIAAGSLAVPCIQKFQTIKLYSCRTEAFQVPHQGNNFRIGCQHAEKKACYSSKQASLASPPSSYAKAALTDS